MMSLLEKRLMAKLEGLKSNLVQSLVALSPVFMKLARYFSYLIFLLLERDLSEEIEERSQSYDFLGRLAIISVVIIWLIRSLLSFSFFSAICFFSISFILIYFSRIFSPIFSLVFLRMTIIQLSCILACTSTSLNSLISSVWTESSVNTVSLMHLSSQILNLSIMNSFSSTAFLRELTSSLFQSYIFERISQLQLNSLALPQDYLHRICSLSLSVCRVSISFFATCSSASNFSVSFLSRSSKFCNFYPFLVTVVVAFFSSLTAGISISSVCTDRYTSLASSSSFLMEQSKFTDFFTPISNLSSMVSFRFSQKSLVTSSGRCNLDRYCLNSKYLSWQVSSKIFQVFSRVISALSLISCNSLTALDGCSFSTNPFDMKMLSWMRCSSSAIFASSFSQQFMAKSQCSISLACYLRFLTGSALCLTTMRSISFVLTLLSRSFSLESIWMRRACDRKLKPLIMSICTLRKQSQRKVIRRSWKQLSTSLKASSIILIMLRRQKTSSE